MNAANQGYSFERSKNVIRTKVSFHNRYGITLAGDLYLPQNADGNLAAVAVAGPFGAVKELVLIPGAVHTDLYDRKDIIPFDKIESFLKQYLQ